MEKGAWPHETCQLNDRNLWVSCLRISFFKLRAVVFCAPLVPREASEKYLCSINCVTLAAVASLGSGILPAIEGDKEKPSFICSVWGDLKRGQVGLTPRSRLCNNYSKKSCYCGWDSGEPARERGRRADAHNPSQTFDSRGVHLCLTFKLRSSTKCVPSETARPTPRFQLCVSPRQSLTCQAAKLLVPQLAHAAQVVALGQARCAGFGMALEGRGLRAPLCRPAGHGSRLKSAGSRPPSPGSEQSRRFRQS